MQSLLFVLAFVMTTAQTPAVKADQVLVELRSRYTVVVRQGLVDAAELQDADPSLTPEITGALVTLLNDRDVSVDVWPLLERLPDRTATAAAVRAAMLRSADPVLLPAGLGLLARLTHQEERAIARDIARAALSQGSPVRQLERVVQLGISGRDLVGLPKELQTESLALLARDGLSDGAYNAGCNLVGLWSPNPAVPALELLRSSSWSARENGALVLYRGRVPAPEATRLLAEFTHTAPDASARGNSARALGVIADEAAVPALVRALADRDSWVRAAAAEALGNYPSAWGQTKEPLTRALTDESEVARTEAARAIIAVMKTQGASRRQIETAIGPILSHPTPFDRQQVSSELNTFGMTTYQWVLWERELFALAAGFILCVIAGSGALIVRYRRHRRPAYALLAR